MKALLENNIPTETTTVDANGVGEYAFRPTLDFSKLPEVCEYHNSSWAQITNDATGETHWSSYDVVGENGLTGSARFMKTGIRYPGGSLTLRLFSKVQNGFKCYDSSEPSDTAGLIAHHVEKVDVKWPAPKILSVGLENYSGTEYMVVGVSPEWEDFDGNRLENGVTLYEITNYGYSDQVVEPLEGWPCLRPGGQGTHCIYQGSIRGNKVLGAASIPNNVEPETTSLWPPAEAISFNVGFPLNKGPADYPKMTQAGQAESTNCSRKCIGDPIDSYSGNFYEKTSDLVIPGRIGIDLTRNYAVGMLTQAGAFGDGWTLGYDMKVKGAASSSEVTLIEPSGNETVFKKTSGNYTPQSTMVRADLKKVTAGWEFKRWDEDLTHVFNNAGQLISIRDQNNNAVTIEHANGKVSKISEGNHFVELAWSDEKLSSLTDHTNRVVAYAYNPKGQLASRTDPLGAVKTYSYDANNRVKQMVFEDGGIVKNAYDAQGRVIRQDLPSGQVIKLGYGANNSGQRINTETSGDVTKTYTYLNGRIIGFTDSSDPGANFTRTYDNLGRLVSSAYTEGVPRKDVLGYDNAGNLSWKKEVNSNATDRFEWDGKRQLMVHVQPTGVRSENSYDTLGNLTATTVIPTDGGSPRTTEYTVSPLGEPATITNPLGGITTLGYSPAGELLTATDPVGGITSYEYDSLGRTVKTVSAGGNVPGLSAAAKAKFTEKVSYDLNGNALEVTNQSGVTTYGYDPLGQAVSITDPRGKVKTVEYDPAGKPVTVIHPDNSVDTFTYDPNTGLRTSWVDPQGLTTHYSHQNGVSTTTQPNGTTTSLKQIIGKLDTTVELIDAEHPGGVVVRKDTALDSHVYPTGDDTAETNVSTRNSAGQILSDLADGITVNYTYNGFGELTSQSGQGRDVAYGYDPAGNINSITYPDGSSISREMDAAGRITKITDWKGVTYTLGYNISGQITSMVSSSGLSYAQEHDGALTTSKIWKDSLGTVLATFENEHEASGLLISDSKHVGTDPADVRDFQWNNNGSLAKIGNKPVTWDGRLMTNTGSLALDYDAATSRVTSATGSGVDLSYGYDSAGNRTSSTSSAGTTEYQWDLFGKLTGLDNTSYSYGNDGLRTSVNDKQQVYDQGLKLLSDGAAKYLWSPDGSLLAQDSLGRSATPAVAGEAITDTMGSVYSLVTQENGAFAALAQYSYTAFGERTLTSGTNVSAMGFTSEQHDDSGLIYLRFRYMDPQIGQFISVDPLVSSTLDPYGYASGNPLQMVDPLGLWSWNDLYENASNISMGLSITGLALDLTIVAAPVGVIFGAVSSIFSVMSAVKNFREGNTAEAWVDVASAALGVVGGGAIIRGVYKGGQAIKASAPSRNELKNNIMKATAKSDSLEKFSTDLSRSMLISTNAGKGVLC